MLLRLIPFIACLIIKSISKTLRLKISGIEEIIQYKIKGKNYIFAFWHDQFFIMPYYYRKILGKSNISVLTSRSRDGEYISRLLHKFRFNTVRGSSSYGGETALRMLIREIENGNDIAVTPDGPRGPRHIVQTGAITLASITGCPIVPVGCKAYYKKTLHTWDKFIIPYPFSGGLFTISSPIYVPKDIPDQVKEEIRQKLENILLSISLD